MQPLIKQTVMILEIIKKEKQNQWLSVPLEHSNIHALTKEQTIRTPHDTIDRNEWIFK